MDLTTPIPIPGDLELEPHKATIVSVLRTRALLHPEKRAFVFLANGEDESGSLTYGELDRAARSVAGTLLAKEKNGSHVLMFYPPGFDFIIAFFGCLYAGVIPAAVYPPRKNRSLNRIRTIATDCQAGAILTTSAIARSMERNFAEDPSLSGLPWHATDTWYRQEETAGKPVKSPGPVPPERPLSGNDEIRLKANPDAPDVAAMLPSLGENGPVDEGVPSHTREPGFEEMAFLQYTSGSTGDPKGVMVSHRNIMYNLRSLQIIFGIVPGDTAVHWVPQFHDLGLIFGILETVFSGSTTIQIPPFVFISNPLSLLQAITKYRATVSGQPDFAFNHCVDKIDELSRSRLDLSTLRVMYSGAEPVRKATFDRFLDWFAPAGLTSEALIPAYGMAESTLILTGARERGPTHYLPVSVSGLEKNLLIPVSDSDPSGEVQWIASNGKPTMDTSVIITDPETTVIQQPGRIGEIWASGSTITMGYYNKPGVTADAFHARLAGQNDPVWLRTGDLGFLYNGELYITGRQKDLVIVHGRNLYPQDIESVVEACHPSIRKTCTAAFSIEHGGHERLAIVAELKRSLFHHDTGKIFEAILSVIARDFEIQPVRIALIRTGSVIKTSSGKIMRGANREALLNGGFDVVADRIFKDREVAPAEYGSGGPMNLEQFLISWVSLRLNQGLSADPSCSLLSYGIDSLRAVELRDETKINFGFEWPPHLLFQEISLTDLAKEGMKFAEGENVSN